MDYEKFGNVIKYSVNKNENKLIIEFSNNKLIELLIKTNINNSTIIIFWPDYDNVYNNIDNIIGKKINSINFTNINIKYCYDIFLNFDIILGDNLVKIPVLVKYSKTDFNIQYPNKEFNIEMFYEIKTQLGKEEKTEKTELNKENNQLKKEETTKNIKLSKEHIRQKKQKEIPIIPIIPKLGRKYINYKYQHNSLELGIGLGIGFGVGFGILFLSRFFTK